MRRKIQLTNKTHWQPRQLLAFIREAARRTFTETQKPILRVEIVYGRGWGSSGRGSIGGNWSRVRLPKDPALLDRRAFASVLCHEFAHNAGMANERRMRGCAKYGWKPGWRDHYEWADALPLEPKPAKVRRRVTASDKLKRARASLSRWLSKRKRAETAIRKYKRQIRYYEARQAAPDSVGASEAARPA